MYASGIAAVQHRNAEQPHRDRDHQIEYHRSAQYHRSALAANRNIGVTTYADWGADVHGSTIGIEIGIDDYGSLSSLALDCDGRKRHGANGLVNV
jgi:hypothetical protein